jgi:hypothetical protein
MLQSAKDYIYEKSRSLARTLSSDPRPSLARMVPYIDIQAASDSIIGRTGSEASMPRQLMRPVDIHCKDALDRNMGCYISHDLDKEWVNPDDVTKVFPLFNNERKHMFNRSLWDKACKEINMIRYDLYNPMVEVKLESTLGLVCKAMKQSMDNIVNSNGLITFGGMQSDHYSTINFDFKIRAHSAKTYTLEELEEYVQDKMKNKKIHLTLENTDTFLKKNSSLLGKYTRVEGTTRDGRVIYIWVRNVDVDIEMPDSQYKSEKSWKNYINDIVKEFNENEQSNILCFIGRLVDVPKEYNSNVAKTVNKLLEGNDPLLAKKLVAPFIYNAVKSIGKSFSEDMSNYVNSIHTGLKNLYEGGHRVSFVIDKVHKEMFFYDPLRMDWYIYAPTETQLGRSPVHMRDTINVVALAFEELFSSIPSLDDYTFLHYNSSNKLSEYIREQNLEIGSGYNCMKDTVCPINFIQKSFADTLKTSFGPYTKEELSNRRLNRETFFENDDQQALSNDWFGGYCGLYNIFLNDLLARNPTCSAGNIIWILEYLGTQSMTGDIPLIVPFIRSYAKYIESKLYQEPVRLTAHHPKQPGTKGKITDTLVYTVLSPDELTTYGFANYPFNIIMDQSKSTTSWKDRRDKYTLFDMYVFDPKTSKYSFSVSGDNLYTISLLRYISQTADIASVISDAKKTKTKIKSFTPISKIRSSVSLPRYYDANDTPGIIGSITKRIRRTFAPY